MPVNPLIAQGRGIFEANGCAGCHGDTGMGTPIAPSLVGVTSRYPSDQLAAVLHNPTAKMRAGRMPSVDLSAADMSALLNYLGAVGTTVANIQPAYNLVPSPRPVIAAREVAPGTGQPLVTCCTGSRRRNRRSWSANVSNPMHALHATVRPAQVPHARRHLPVP